MSPRPRPAAGQAGGPAAAAPAPPPPGPDGKPLTFEKALERLEGIVEQLEDGKLTLEDSIARFEEGVVVSRFLEGELGRAEQRVQELVDHAGTPATRPWADDDEPTNANEADDDDDGDAV